MVGVAWVEVLQVTGQALDLHRQVLKPRSSNLLCAQWHDEKAKYQQQRQHARRGHDVHHAIRGGIRGRLFPQVADADLEEPGEVVRHVHAQVPAAVAVRALGHVVDVEDSISAEARQQYEDHIEVELDAHGILSDVLVPCQEQVAPPKIFRRIARLPQVVVGVLQLLPETLGRVLRNVFVDVAAEELRGAGGFHALQDTHDADLLVSVQDLRGDHVEKHLAGNAATATDTKSHDRGLVECEA
mmetsp:Transcript_13406/g.38624  ORF Transcript_13406/g.38624 Transcript_13406/m.38624 type:complete len:242 (-) Transcript_13406:1454-2179(-)